MSANIYTVARLNQEAKQLLESGLGTIWVEAEISNLSMPVSGHWYFTLKDSRAQVRCAMFKGRNRMVAFKPEHGKKVLVRGKLSLYEPRGDYQLIAESMQMAGDGRLQQAFEALKLKLAAQGLFSDANKKSLPAHTQKVGIITSSTGAALQDMIQVLSRRDPSLEIVIYPVQVQGETSALQITKAIELANTRNEVDVIVVGRGGGSLEDLWSFNEESVANAIYTSNLPIISAVGHETDVSIADLVADVRAPTPSAAAEIVSRDTEQLMQVLDHKEKQLSYAVKHLLQYRHQAIHKQIYRLQEQHPKTQLRTKLQQLELKKQNLIQMISTLLANKQHQAALQADKLNAYSPLATLSRGYSITTDSEDNVLYSKQGVQLGQQIKTRLNDGIVRSEVIEIEEDQ